MRASRGEDPVAVMEEVVLVASRTLDAELVAVIELLADGRGALLRAGSGWGPGTIGGVVPALLDASGTSGEPVTVERVGDHELWRTHPLLATNGVACGAVVPIPGRPGPFVAVSVASRVASSSPRTISVISVMARAQRSARFRISSATTAKPRPCSPARAASTAALSANKFV